MENNSTTDAAALFAGDAWFKARCLRSPSRSSSSVLRAPTPSPICPGMAQGVGYLLASAGPLLTGLLYNAFGRGAVATLCIGISAAALLFRIGAGRTGHVQTPVR